MAQDYLLGRSTRTESTRGTHWGAVRLGGKKKGKKNSPYGQRALARVVEAMELPQGAIWNGPRPGRACAVDRALQSQQLNRDRIVTLSNDT